MAGTEAVNILEKWAIIILSEKSNEVSTVAMIGDRTLWATYLPMKCQSWFCLH